MAKKKKVRRLTDEQYNAYITSLKYDPASYNADGSRVVPDELNARGEDAPKGRLSAPPPLCLGVQP